MSLPDSVSFGNTLSLDNIALTCNETTAKANYTSIFQRGTVIANKYIIHD